MPKITDRAYHAFTFELVSYAYEVAIQPPAKSHLISNRGWRHSLARNIRWFHGKFFTSFAKKTCQSSQISAFCVVLRLYLSISYGIWMQNIHGLSRFCITDREECCITPAILLPSFFVAVSHLFLQHYCPIVFCFVFRIPPPQFFIFFDDPLENISDSTTLLSMTKPLRWRVNTYPWQWKWFLVHLKQFDSDFSCSSTKHLFQKWKRVSLSLSAAYLEV